MTSDLDSPHVKLTPERRDRILDAIRAGATRRAAAGHANVDESTLWRWTQRNATFASDLARAEHDVEVRYAALIQHAASDDWRAAAWWLERRRPADYAQRERVDIHAYVIQRATELGLDPQ